MTDKTTNEIREYYNATVQDEWNRIANRPEFLLTCRMLDRYLKPGDKILDIGGGPGRYTMYLAQKGCNVTLLDLSPENTKFAAEEALRQNLTISTITGDAREADTLATGPYDHVLLMGPLYHLLEEPDRIKAINAALKLLKPGGLFFASFVNMFAGMIYAMKDAPEIILSSTPAEVAFRECVIAKKSFAGDAFTQAFFIELSEILPFMAQFPLEKLHLFSQEGITAPCETNIMSQPKEIVDAWLDFSEKIWEREEFLSWAKHLMYVGRKQAKAK